MPELLSVLWLLSSGDYLTQVLAGLSTGALAVVISPVVFIVGAVITYVWAQQQTHDWAQSITRR
ncbi:hypothetical protein [Haloferax gibbonsii]|uniref:Uncharacterized protein n=1 Tax=Haloferax gibbonsii TaxID=35746 RepID=A0A0K1J006_HALGI|nr:hypothetical protein [Haloferax gibbonsii]AKU09880.1 hypothetical protein ABY42_18860 [Haloferax gibbonsii]